MQKKLLIVLLAGANGHENMARALHALLYALQAKAKGIAVEVIFDGAGTEWAAKLPKDEHLQEIYQQLLDGGVIKGVCAFCSTAFHVEEELKMIGSTFLDEDNGHPNIGARIADGWEVLII